MSHRPFSAFVGVAAAAAAGDSTLRHSLPFFLPDAFYFRVVHRFYQTFAGILWTSAKAIEVGFIRRSAGDVLAACDFEVRWISGAKDRLPTRRPSSSSKQAPYSRKVRKIGPSNEFRSVRHTVLKEASTQVT